MNWQFGNMEKSMYRKVSDQGQNTMSLRHDTTLSLCQIKHCSLYTVQDYQRGPVLFSFDFLTPKLQI